jgi:hypothetical protein
MQTGPEFLLSVSSYKGILYFDNFGGVQLKQPPCSCNISKLPHFKKEQNSRKKVPKKVHFFKIKGPIGDKTEANRNY